jgi:hypothetical protein
MRRRRIFPSDDFADDRRLPEAVEDCAETACDEDDRGQGEENLCGQVRAAIRPRCRRGHRRRGPVRS